jgi:hypothetical protein
MNYLLTEEQRQQLLDAFLKERAIYYENDSTEPAPEHIENSIRVLQSLKPVSDEPKLSDFFCGVDVTDSLLTVSVLRRRTDDVAEVLHSEQIELPHPSPLRELTDTEVWQLATASTIGGDLHADKFARAVLKAAKETT